jgi:hypothetical protein
MPQCVPLYGHDAEAIRTMEDPLDCISTIRVEAGGWHGLLRAAQCYP